MTTCAQHEAELQAAIRAIRERTEERDGMKRAYEMERDSRNGVEAKYRTLAGANERAQADNTRLVAELEATKVGRARAYWIGRVKALQDENTSLEEDLKKPRIPLGMAQALELANAENTRLRGEVESYVASQETYHAGRLHGCSGCDPLSPWNEADTDETGPTREQFTHWPECRIGKLKAATSDKQAIRQPGEVKP